MRMDRSGRPRVEGFPGAVVAGLWGLLIASSGASAQCPTATFDAAGGGTLIAQGFVPEDAEVPQFQQTPDGGLRWTSSAQATPLLIPPDWAGPAGGPGTSQFIKVRARVISCPLVFTPEGAHDSGFAIYRGVCVQGGLVVVGLADDRLFVSIRNMQTGAEIEYCDVPFDTRAGVATFYVRMTTAMIAMACTAGEPTQDLRIGPGLGQSECPAGRYSPNSETYRMGDGSPTGAADVVLYEWHMGRELLPDVWAPEFTIGGDLIGGLDPTLVELQVGNLAPDLTTTRWEWREADSMSWTPLSLGANQDAEGHVRFNAIELVEGAGAIARVKAEMYCENGPRLSSTIRLRSVASNTCGTTPGTPAVIEFCPADMDGNGQLSVQDVFTFLQRYFDAPPGADFNRDGEHTPQDIFDFVAAFFAGCE